MAQQSCLSAQSAQCTVTSTLFNLDVNGVSGAPAVAVGPLLLDAFHVCELEAMHLHLLYVVMPILMFLQTVNHAQLKSSELCMKLDKKKYQIMELEQELEEVVLLQPTATSHSTKTQNAMNNMKIALRKFVGLYNLFPPYEVSFYEQNPQLIPVMSTIMQCSTIMQNQHPWDSLESFTLLSLMALNHALWIPVLTLLAQYVIASLLSLFLIFCIIDED